jgi:hypothetical protein
MLVHQIISRVQSLVEDPDFWTFSKIVAMCNQCKDSISDHFGLQANGYKLMNSVVGQRSYSLPMDFIALDMITWGDGNCLTPANKVSAPRDARTYLSYADTPGTPYSYFFWGKEDVQEIWFIPTFESVKEIEFFYWRRIPDVVNANDEPMIPRDLHDKIVDYCERKTWYSDELHNYTPERFDSWWMDTLQTMQIAKNVQLAGSDTISMGNFNDRMPGQNEDNNVGFPFGINSNDGVIW